MKFSDVIQFADPGRDVPGGMDLREVLRLNVMPQFLNDIDQQIGKVYWRRKDLTLTTAIGGRQLDLPLDFGTFDMLTCSVDGQLGEILPMDDDTQNILATEHITTNGIPKRYRIVHSNTVGKTHLYAVRFSQPWDRVTDLKALYYWDFNTPNTQEQEEVGGFQVADDYDLDPYIPQKRQWLVVELLKAEILKQRYDLGDKRFVGQMELYGKGIEAMKRVGKEANKSRRMTYVR